MPVANLQSYRTVALRVQSTAFAAQGLAAYMETALFNKLHQKCGFEHAGRVGQQQADVVLDVNITNRGRGGGGWIQNSSQATIDTLLVLTDGINGELLGTARIKGKSSGMIVNNAAPENEAIEAVANEIASLLAKSGCAGPRVARTEPPPPPPPNTGSGGSTGSATEQGSGNTTPPVDDKKRADAEALNEQGKEKLRSADVGGALALFQQANATVPDARYQYNVCLALEALERWNDAVTACKQARAMTQDSRLAGKIDHRLELIANHQ